MEVANTPIRRTEVPRMCHSNQQRLQHPVQFLRRQFLPAGDFPCTNLLTEAVLAQALSAVTGWLDRIFSPLLTLWVFLGQVLCAETTPAAPRSPVSSPTAWHRDNAPARHRPA